jgi:hypothetical protein
MDLSKTGAGALQQQLYFCMFGQALRMKSQLEGWRANNIWGVLLWQFNEVWPTGGWGSIEYGTPVKGQVSGGRWKPLQYMLQAAGGRILLTSAVFTRGMIGRLSRFSFC